MGLFRGSFANRAPAESPDDVLVRSFVNDSNAVALSTLVERHLPMVFRVCRSILGKDHDAEDATQATFLVLTQRASTIRNQNSLASWLHGVALQSAKAVQRRELRERKRVESAKPQQSTGDVLDDLTLREAREILHSELDALSERDKLPILLVHFEDCSHEEAAAILHLSLPTFRGRLERARERLGARLARHRLSLTATLSLVLLTVTVSPAMASTVTASLLTNSHSASVTAAAAMVPASAKSSTLTTGLSLLTAGTAALFIAVPLLWPSVEPRGVSVATAYPIGHILIARGDHVAVLNPDDGRAVPVSPSLTAGRFATIRIRTDAMAYQRDDGTLHVWRFDEPFPGLQVARKPEAFAWLEDGRLAVIEVDTIQFIRITTGDRESQTLPKKLHAIDIHPNGESLFVITNENKPAIFNRKTETVQPFDLAGTADDFKAWRFSPSGTMLGGIAGGDTPVLKIVDLASRAIQNLPCPDAGRFFAWSPDGKLALVGRRSVPASLMLVPVEIPDAPRGLSLDPRYRNLGAILQYGGADWCR